VNKNLFAQEIFNAVANGTTDANILLSLCFNILLVIIHCSSMTKMKESKNSHQKGLREKENFYQQFVRFFHFGHRRTMYAGHRPLNDM